MALSKCLEPAYTLTEHEITHVKESCTKDQNEDLRAYCLEMALHVFGINSLVYGCEFKCSGGLNDMMDDLRASNC